MTRIIIFLLAALTFAISNHAIALGDVSSQENPSATPLENVKHLSYKPDSNSDNQPGEAEISGASCDDLKGKLYSPISGKSWYEGQFYCFPYVNDVHKYINDDLSEIDTNHIKFQNGFELLKIDAPDITREQLRQNMSDKNRIYDDEVRAKFAKELNEVPVDAKMVGSNFYKVKNIEKCGEENDVFCATIDQYIPAPKLDNKFQVFCWKCDSLESSPQELQDAILFYRSGYGLLLKGGVAFEYDQAAGRLIPQLRTVLISDKEKRNE